MAELRDYLLKFDLDKFRNQLDSVSGSYTDFGEQLRTSIQGTTDSFENLKSKTIETSNQLDQVSPQIDSSAERIKASVDASAKGIDRISRYSSTVVYQLKSLSDKGMGAKPSGDAKNSMKQLSEFKDAFESINKVAETSKKKSSLAKKGSKTALDIVKKGKDRIVKGIKAEVRAAKSKVSGLMNSIPGLGKGVIGGLIGAMVLGYTETDRLRFWSGEVLNVFEASGEALDSKASKNAISWFAKFQDTSENLMGISRKGVQVTLKTMIDAGYRSKDIMRTFDSSLGQVGHNLGVATIALDKHFNQETGTSIKNITKITQEVGGSLEDVTHDYALLGFAAQRSGMGISKFVDSVMAGASGMKQYGVEMRSVANTMTTIQDHYKKMGLSSQYAGGQAQQVVQGLTSGLSNMDPSVKLMLAQKLFPEYSALDAVQKWEDGFKRVAAGDDDDFMGKVYQEMYNWAAGAGKGDRSTAIKMLEFQGLDNRTAATIVDLKGEIATANALKKLSAGERKKLRKSFQTEAEQLSDLAKLQFKLKRAIAQVGRGLIKVLVSLVGGIALLVKGIPALLVNIGDPSALLQISSTMGTYMDNLTAHASAGIDDIYAGGKKAAKALGQEFGGKAEFKPIIDIITWKPPIGKAEKFIGDAYNFVKGNMSEESHWKKAYKHATGSELTTRSYGLNTEYVNPYNNKSYESAEAATRSALLYKHALDHYKEQYAQIKGMVDSGQLTPAQGLAKENALKNSNSASNKLVREHQNLYKNKKSGDVETAGDRFLKSGFKLIINKDELGTEESRNAAGHQGPMGA